MSLMYVDVDGGGGVGCYGVDVRFVRLLLLLLCFLDVCCG